MNTKQRLLATLKGLPTDQIPYVPRLDIWYNANSLNGTLPPKYKNASLRELADDLDLGYHSIVPNFRDFLHDEGDLDIGIGLYHLNHNPWRLKLHNVKRTYIRESGGGLRVTYETPKGIITTRVVLNEEMRRTGLTLYVITEHAIKSHADYPAMAFILENMEVTPDYEKYTDYKNQFIGDRGFAVALSAMFASPGHYMIKELMPFDTFYYENMDNPDEMEAFMEQIRPFCDRLFKAALHSPAEVILSGANYDASITAPSMFESYILPELKSQSQQVHDLGKFLATHTDGENRGLLPLFSQAGFDIADSICPAPMTKVSLADTRNAFDGKITIWGGIPSIAVLKNSFSDYEFEKLIDDTFSSVGKGDHLILSIADTVPPAAEFDRILYIKKKAEEFGPVQP